MGFTEKQKIAFAQSQTVPVIHDGTKVVKDSWAIAWHLDEAYAEKPLFKSEMALSYAHFAAGWVDTAVQPALFSSASDLCDRVRPVDQPISRIARQAAGHDRLRQLPGQGPREGGDGVPAVLEPARRVLKEQPFLCGEHPAIPTMPRGCPSWARRKPACASAMIRSMPGASACSICSTAWAARPRRREVRRRHLRPADGADRFVDLVERRRGLARRRDEVAPALSPRDHLRLRPLQTL